MTSQRSVVFAEPVRTAIGTFRERAQHRGCAKYRPPIVETYV